MSDNLDGYLNSVVEAGGYGSKYRLHRHLDYLLGDCSGVEKALDIGGGAGLLSLYIASQGADEVVLLEPEGEGSTSAITDLFRRLQERVPNGERVELRNQIFQEYDPGDDKFDLIVCANAINHLNEPACVDLQTNRESYETYMGYFRRLFDMMTPGGRVVISDCSSRNLFRRLGMTNPLMPTIEWEKHQPPRQWVSMFQEAGFVDPKIQWSSYNALGPLGRVLMGNSVVNYMTLSHFKFTMRRP